MKYKYRSITHHQHWKDYDSYYIMEEHGYGMVRVTKEDNQLTISDLYVKEQCRKQGLGKYLLLVAINTCKNKCLHGTIELYFNKSISEEFIKDWYVHEGFVFDHVECPIDLDSSDDCTTSNDWYDVFKYTF